MLLLWLYLINIFKKNMEVEALQSFLEISADS